jgi:DNA-directed RNA polymerase subunit RPC12/RpoP
VVIFEIGDHMNKVAKYRVEFRCTDCGNFWKNEYDLKQRVRIDSRDTYSIDHKDEIRCPICDSLYIEEKWRELVTEDRALDKLPKE